MKKYLAQEIKMSYNSKIKRSELELSNSSRNAYDYLKPIYEHDVNLFESSVILLLNRKNAIVGWYKLSVGGTSGTVIDVKIICKIAIDCLASSIILSHNHPSGNLNPSRSDKDITMKVKNALALFDISLLDHLIITEDSYRSFADEGEM